MTNPLNGPGASIAAVVISVVVIATALVVLPIALGGDACAGDCPDQVTRRGTDYVLMFDCNAVQRDVLRSPDRGDFKPAAGGVSEDAVLTYVIEGLPAGEVVAVEGPRALVCPRGRNPGRGIAFSPEETDAQTVSRTIAALRQGQGN